MPLVTPDFPDHHKTRFLAKLTGNDAAPMAVIRLWCHCHNCKRYEFPNMTPEQLASIVHWTGRKITAEDALVQAGFLEKLSPSGYKAHDFDQVNAGLCQRWQAGAKGGRPGGGHSATEKSIENAASAETGAKPYAPSRLTGKEPINQPTNQSINNNQPTNQAPAVGHSKTEPVPATPEAQRMDLIKSIGGIGRSDGGAGGIASKRALTFRIPTEPEVFNYLNAQNNMAGQFAKSYLKAMNKSGWKGKDGRQVQDWKAHALEYANTAARNQLGVSKTC